MTDSDVIQDHMPDNVCFGCGRLNPNGLQIESRMQGDLCVAEWQPLEKYHGWEEVLNGGILATLIDCHTMAAALEAAYRSEGRAVGTEPVYRYATGTITVRYLKPTMIAPPVRLEARVLSAAGRKTTVHCDVFSDGEKTAEADVVAVRVFEGEGSHANPFR